MEIFMTSGTPEFMENLRKKHADEQMIVMHGENNTLLLHETNGKTVFQTPRRYEVISSSGTFEKNGYFVMANIPVADEGRPVFEHHYNGRERALDTEPGFIAFRLLRPQNSDTYIVMTEWSNITYYTMWKGSTSFKHTHFTDRSEVGVNNTLHIFTSASSLTTYIAKVEDEA